MNNRDVIPDALKNQLNEFSDWLWTNRAVVMVGAGFSKNSSSKFPDWAALADVFYEETRGRKPDEDSSRYLSVLKVAEEFEAAKGRPELKRIIHEQIPDDESNPSVLHKRLLELPWVDLLTTNYDTLLERANDEAATQKYDVVKHQKELLSAFKPRIIKLHGTLSSDAPLTITEEDYRRYPEKHIGESSWV